MSTTGSFFLSIIWTFSVPAQLRWIRHFGHAVTSLDAPLSHASFNRSNCQSRVLPLQLTKAALPQQAAISRLRGISTSSPHEARMSRGAWKTRACLPKRHGS